MIDVVVGEVDGGWRRIVVDDVVAGRSQWKMSQR